MLPAFKRIKLALVLMPALLFPLLWIVSLLIAPHQEITSSVIVVIVLQGVFAAFVAAYAIASFIEYLRVLRSES